MVTALVLSIGRLGWAEVHITNRWGAAHQKVRTPHTICMRGNHIRGGMTWSIRLSWLNIQHYKYIFIFLTFGYMRRTGYHSNNIAASEDRIDFLRSIICQRTYRKESRMEECTLKSVPCMFNSSFMPDTYALFTFDLSRSMQEDNYQAERKMDMVIRH